ncbi:hypothetical protein HYU82_01575 [Candidatus Saccharibacteria bacterium]|nr:hypothetical protein [Candidatus Saccharibacteria bacterium]MBI2285496.1 hypothetical protein [Candidatus Saccharibacteria bacterium]
MKLQILFSYLDPGTGSIIVQSIVGVVAGVGLFGRRIFINSVTKARNLFKKNKKD